MQGRCGESPRRVPDGVMIHYFAANVSDDSSNGEEQDVQSHMFSPTFTDMQDKYCGDCYDMYLIQSENTKMAAFGRQHKRGGVAFGGATSFVVAFVLALNRVNVVAVTTILVLHVGVIGHHIPCHYDFMFPRRSYHARRWSPIYFRKLSKNENPSPIYFASNSPKVDRTPRSTVVSWSK